MQRIDASHSNPLDQLSYTEYTVREKKVPGRIMTEPENDIFKLPEKFRIHGAVLLMTTSPCEIYWNFPYPDTCRQIVQAMHEYANSNHRQSIDRVGEYSISFKNGSRFYCKPCKKYKFSSPSDLYITIPYINFMTLLTRSNDLSKIEESSAMPALEQSTQAQV